MPTCICANFYQAPWDHIQDNLFPWLRGELGPLTDLHKRVIVMLELARVETLVGRVAWAAGGPPSDRAALARAFVAKAAKETSVSEDQAG